MSDKISRELAAPAPAAVRYSIHVPLPAAVGDDNALHLVVNGRARPRLGEKLSFHGPGGRLDLIIVEVEHDVGATRVMSTGDEIRATAEFDPDMPPQDVLARQLLHPMLQRLWCGSSPALESVSSRH